MKNTVFTAGMVIGYPEKGSNYHNIKKYEVVRYSSQNSELAPFTRLKVISLARGKTRNVTFTRNKITTP